jgi:YjbR
LRANFQEVKYALTMVSIEEFTNMALALPGAEEKRHFHLASFRTKNKIFATLWENENRVMLKLSLVSQSVFCAFDKTIFFPVPGGWGAKGATFVDLSKVKKAMLKDALKTAYKELTDKKK